MAMNVPSPGGRPPVFTGKGTHGTGLGYHGKPRGATTPAKGMGYHGKPPSYITKGLRGGSGNHVAGGKNHVGKQMGHR